LGQEYVEVICRSKISLGFVSSSNRDQYTMRTFEIPACNGFLLAQRTDRHMELFIEGKEAEFFESTEECADKINFYLEHESARKRIADGGYNRCLKSDYSLNRSLSLALLTVHKMKKF
jgi:spore maturation protein CgeB